MSLTKLHKSYRIVAALMRECWNIEGKKYESASGRKYMWRNWTNPTEHDCSPQVANAHRPKTASCRATNECEWVTPTSVASPRVQFSNKHQLLMITHENFWVMWLQSFFPSSWGVRSPDWLSSQSGNLTRVTLSSLKNWDKENKRMRGLTWLRKMRDSAVCITWEHFNACFSWLSSANNQTYNKESCMKYKQQ